MPKLNFVSTRAPSSRLWWEWWRSLPLLPSGQTPSISPAPTSPAVGETRPRDWLAQPPVPLVASSVPVLPGAPSQTLPATPAQRGGSCLSQSSTVSSCPGWQLSPWQLSMTESRIWTNTRHCQISFWTMSLTYPGHLRWRRYQEWLCWQSGWS